MEFDTPNSFYKTKKLRYNQIVNDIQYDTFMLTAEVIKLLNKYEMSTSESAYIKFRANYAKLDFELKDLFRIYRALKFKLFTNPKTVDPKACPQLFATLISSIINVGVEAEDACNILILSK